MLKYLFVALIFLAAPARTTADTVDDAFAVVEFHRGFVGGGLTDPTRQEYMVVDADGGGFTSAALFNMLRGGDSRLQRYPAGQRLSIHATTRVTRFLSDGVAPCNGLARFTPAAGRTYSVTQAQIREGVCEFRVIDTTTGAAPADLEVSNDVVSHY